MTEDQRVLAALLDNHVLIDEDDKVKGIAQLALDKGFENLSTLQQRVVQPFMSKRCSGMTDPGGHHNDCTAILEGDTMIEAAKNLIVYEALICESCRNDADYYAHQWERIQRE